MGDLLNAIAARPGWELLSIEAADWDDLPLLPADLTELRRRCGGVTTPGGLVVGQRVRSAQRAILGEAHPDDRSFHWYVIAEEDEGGTSERVVIDLHPDRLGRCYEAFWDRFGVVGSMPTVASSVTNLLERLLAANGEPYWSDGPTAGPDAYD